MSARHASSIKGTQLVWQIGLLRLLMNAVKGT